MDPSLTVIRNHPSITPYAVITIINRMERLALQPYEPIVLIEDILCWHLRMMESENVAKDSENTVAIADMLATVSDAELYILWYITVCGLTINELISFEPIQERKEQWFQEKFNAARHLNVQQWGPDIKIGIERFSTARNEKEALITKLYEDRNYMMNVVADLVHRTSHIMQILLEHVDRLTLCIFWEYLTQSREVNRNLSPNYWLKVDNETSLESIRPYIHDYLSDDFGRIYGLLSRFVPIAAIKDFWYLDDPSNCWNPKIADPHYREQRPLTLKEHQDLSARIRADYGVEIGKETLDLPIQQLEQRIAIEKDLLAHLKDVNETLEEKKRRDDMISAIEEKIMKMEESLQKKLQKPS